MAGDDALRPDRCEEARRRGRARTACRPGQYVPRGWPVLHYGRVPAFDAAAWDFTVWGATADGETRSLGLGRLRRAAAQRGARPTSTASRSSRVFDNTWTGVATSVLLELVPPAPSVTHVMVWAEYGYSANLRLEDFASASAMFVTHRDGEPLSADHGAPLRLVVPHLYAWKGPKWARGVEYLDRGPARLLGGARLPQPRRPLAGAALQLPGAAGRRART